MQRASGQSWRTYIDDHIFEPAEMTRSGTDDLDGVSGLAVGYSSRSALGRPIVVRRAVPSGQSVASIRPAGSGHATAGDMIRFLEALRSNRLLSPALTETIFTPQVEVLPSLGPDVERAYGYTFDIITTRGVKQVGHSGGAPGMSTLVRYYPDLGWQVVVLSNYDRGALHVSAHLEQILEGM